MFRLPGNDCHLYVLSNGSFCKVGVSKDPLARMKQLQTGNPERLTLEWSFPIQESSAYHLERFIHKHWDETKAEGEWFSVDAGQMSSWLQDLMSELVNWVVREGELDGVVQVALRRHEPPPSHPGVFRSKWREHWQGALEEDGPGGLVVGGQ